MYIYVSSNNLLFVIVIISEVRRKTMRKCTGMDECTMVETLTLTMRINSFNIVFVKTCVMVDISE